MAEQKLMEVSKTTKKVSDSKKALNKPFARPSFGKTNVFTYENDKRIGVTIQINEEQAKILQYAYDLRQEGLSYAKIAKGLTINKCTLKLARSGIMETYLLLLRTE